MNWPRAWAPRKRAKRPGVRPDVANAYQIGHAQGEIRGRLALARELELAFGTEEQVVLTPECATLVRVRQVH